jgi:hypothetical protein
MERAVTVHFDIAVPVTSSEPAGRKERRESRVLVVMAHGNGLCLVCEPGLVLDHLHENGSGASEDGFAFAGHGVDHEPLPDGVYVGELVFIDDGPGDWPGSREVAVSLRKTRLATVEEWTAHLNGEWPWT